MILKATFKFISIQYDVNCGPIYSQIEEAGRPCDWQVAPTWFPVRGALCIFFCFNLNSLTASFQFMKGNSCNICVSKNVFFGLQVYFAPPSRATTSCKKQNCQNAKFEASKLYSTNQWASTSWIHTVLEKHTDTQTCTSFHKYSEHVLSFKLLIKVFNCRPTACIVHIVGHI